MRISEEDPRDSASNPLSAMKGGRERIGKGSNSLSAYLQPVPYSQPDVPHRVVVRLNWKIELLFQVPWPQIGKKGSRNGDGTKFLLYQREGF